MTWEMRPPRPVKITVIGLVLIVSVGLTVWPALVVDQRAGWAFLGALWSFFVGLYLYRLVFRATHRIEIDSGVLSWRSLRREGSFPLTDLWEIRPERCGAGLVLETVAGSKVLVLAPRTVLQVAQGVQEQCPDVPVRISRGTRVASFLLSRRGQAAA
jgi:hypothetical protein